jgi:hypothetical protein
MDRERLREVVRGQVATSRREQGFGPAVSDGRFLGQLAHEVIDHDADTVELPVIGGEAS